MENPQSIFVIIPSYNEGAQLRKTVEGVLAYGYRVVVADDASSDDTALQVAGLSIDYIRHRVNLGQGAALQTGIEFAKKQGAKYFVTFDADGQHDAADIAGMIAVLEEKKTDVVFGSRFLPGAKTNVAASRSFVLQLARYLNYFVSGVLLSDAHNGLRVFNRKAADVIKLTENRMAHATEFQVQVAKAKLKYAEQPVSIHYNEYSKQKGQSNFDSIKIFFEILLYKIFR